MKKSDYLVLLKVSMFEKIENFTIIDKNEEIKNQKEISNKKKVLIYIGCGFLAIIAQLISSGNAVLLVLFVKDIEVDIFVVSFYRAILSSFATLAMAFFIEGGFSFSRQNFNRYIII